MPIQNVSGSKDLNPQQVEENNFLLSKLADVYKRWGYQEISPTKVETLKTLTAGGAIKSKEVLKIVGDEPLGLRPEMTASIARVAATRYAKRPRPLRLWTSGTIFKSRQESDGKVSIDENLHSGVEIFGDQSMEIEVELLSLLMDSLKVLELKDSVNPVLLISHTSLIEIITKRYNENIKYKIRNILTGFNLLELESLDIDKKDIKHLKDLLKLRGKPEFVIKHLTDIYGEEKSFKELSYLFEIISQMSNSCNIEIQLDPTFMPHYKLYNGITFQLVCQGNNCPKVIASGGRYDELVRIFDANNKEHSGAGFSYSIEKIKELDILSEQIKNKTEKILIAYSPSKNIKDALRSQHLFHLEGKIAIIELKSCKNENTAKELLKLRDCNKLYWIDN
ncbi:MULTISPECIES: ATP phosphoribosyltransferase regulatory subunit [Prochlorococcus]|uniref:ATP phosphoribosyltransferase regulatory subunit n=1 Tax=Prochlorococcus TaxID=1218 RepID=UPI00053388C6|nr:MULTISPECIES: ATP phosphoribosyltransferase regulatory subunit [Prochlorococcus]KGG12483.1 ATP phosphoribosyltransferase regulatory subunit [Prochlorococcus sp. MIT 0601]